MSNSNFHLPNVGYDIITVRRHDGAVASTKTTPLATIPLLIPSAPQNFRATPGEWQVTLSWGSPASDGGSAITGYQVFEGNGSMGIRLPDTSRSFLYTGLSSGKSYTFRVRAVNAEGYGTEATTTATTIRNVSPTRSGGCNAMTTNAGLFTIALVVIVRLRVFN
jgi:hypothetical protein